jgi:hypothetical protein
MVGGITANHNTPFIVIGEQLIQKGLPDQADPFVYWLVGAKGFEPSTS